MSEGATNNKTKRRSTNHSTTEDNESQNKKRRGSFIPLSSPPSFTQSSAPSLSLTSSLSSSLSSPPPGHVNSPFSSSLPSSPHFTYGGGDDDVSSPSTITEALSPISPPFTFSSPSDHPTSVNERVPLSPTTVPMSIFPSLPFSNSLLSTTSTRVPTTTNLSSKGEKGKKKFQSRKPANPDGKKMTKTQQRVPKSGTKNTQSKKNDTFKKPQIKKEVSVLQDVFPFFDLFRSFLE